MSVPIFPLIIIACMWINDTMAYIVGSLIGKTPLTVISPKKTWEGTIGGIILCVTVVTITCGYTFFIEPVSFYSLADDIADCLGCGYVWRSF